jgi:hypothetical protein
MHDSVGGDPMWFVQDPVEAGFSSTGLNVIKETDPLGTPSFEVTTLKVASKSPVVPPMQPDGTMVTSNLDSRILKAAEYNNTIVATQTISTSTTQDDARWYQIDVSSGAPTLADEGDVSAGPRTYITYPAIDINANGLIGMSYMESGLSGPFLSTYVTGRLPDDPAGTMETPVLVQAGAKNYHDNQSGQRAGDFSGISVDTDGTFWIANEFANTEVFINYGTTIGHFTISGAGAASAPPQGELPGIGQRFDLGSFTDLNPGKVAGSGIDGKGPSEPVQFLISDAAITVNLARGSSAGHNHSHGSGSDPTLVDTLLSGGIASFGMIYEKHS